MTCVIDIHTYSMEQSPSWEANQFSASQEIPRILWKPKVHYHIHKCPPPVPVHQIFSPGPRLLLWLSRKIYFLRWGVVNTSPNPQARGPLWSAVRDSLFNIFAATLHTGGQQPEDAPCRGVRDLIITDVSDTFIIPTCCLFACYSSTYFKTAYDSRTW